MLDIWDEQMISYGCEIIRVRRDFISQLNQLIQDIHFHLSGKREELVLRYFPNTSEDELGDALKKSRFQDKKQKTTLVGPHRDDIGFYVNKIDIRKFGSQGQQRTAALSLKLAEIELVKKLVRDYPVLLLDDVLSELDPRRQEFVLNRIAGGQVFITCCEEDRLPNLLGGKVFHVEQGRIS